MRLRDFGDMGKGSWQMDAGWSGDGGAVILGNLFDAGSGQGVGERIDVLLETSALRLERIVSVAYPTPPGQWYDQDRPEWVVVLRGEAGLMLEGASEVLVMRAGDHVLLPAHRRHRVEWTDASCQTIWLALHYAPGAESVADRDSIP